jgi:hypothetical protein
MLSCKEVSRLVSESLDRKLPFWQRMGVWIHLSLCRLCRGFRKDLQKLRSAARQHADDIKMDASEPNSALSVEARERMQHALESDDSENQDLR